jgi:2-keto-4-pentenoate hydratase/2-oxohepta-3-ene-1,7-dioic acid hydratase in catechol pathway
MRVKNRDGATVLGPWIVSADEVADPHALELATYVNGTRRQHGSTANMVNDIPALIEYLSDFMTLQPGDVILTGTPEGVGFARKPPVFMKEGDVVSVEIEGLGTLTNPLKNYQ